MQVAPADLADGAERAVLRPARALGSFSVGSGAAHGLRGVRVLIWDVLYYLHFARSVLCLCMLIRISYHVTTGLMHRTEA